MNDVTQKQYQISNKDKQLYPSANAKADTTFDVSRVQKIKLTETERVSMRRNLTENRSSRRPSCLAKFKIREPSKAELTRHRNRVLLKSCRRGAVNNLRNHV